MLASGSVPWTHHGSFSLELHSALRHCPQVHAASQVPILPGAGAECLGRLLPQAQSSGLHFCSCPIGSHSVTCSHPPQGRLGSVIQLFVSQARQMEYFLFIFRIFKWNSFPNAPLESYLLPSFTTLLHVLDKGVPAEAAGCDLQHPVHSDTKGDQAQRQPRALYYLFLRKPLGCFLII